MFFGFIKICVNLCVCKFTVKIIGFQFTISNCIFFGYEIFTRVTIPLPLRVLLSDCYDDARLFHRSYFDRYTNHLGNLTKSQEPVDPHRPKFSSNPVQSYNPA